MKLLWRTLILSLLFAGQDMVYSQGANNPWQKIDETSIVNAAERVTIPGKYKTFRLNKSALEGQLSRAPMEFTQLAKTSSPIVKLPMPDGSFQRFKVVESPIMEPGLAQKFPEIKTYSGQGIDDPSSTVRMDVNPKGFHAIILNKDGDIYIDPYARNSQTELISYYGKDHQRANLMNNFSCDVLGETEDVNHHGHSATESSGDELRTYRLAVATTGEFTAYHGGTVSGALGAVVTIINRVNSIYEKEVAARLILIANNNLIIYTSSTSDPYTNNNNAAMLNQNQNNLASVIGLNNFDVGHVFGTLGGGIAQLQSLCRMNAKGRGASSDPTPVGDAFTVRVVCHEFGHQFGANHTFNGDIGGCNGNRNGGTAYEPGSGSTIMSYAGLCGTQNVSTVTSPYFHTNSYEEITDYTRFGTGNNCATIINTGNNAPVVTVGTGGFVIPIETPFTLRGMATDPDNDTLTYCWEQYNLGQSGPPNAPVGNAPSFRSFPPVEIPERTFPQISTIVNGGTSNSEILPTYSRSFLFRLTARDNRVAGGGVDFEEIGFTATDQAGPFRVTHPNNGATWLAESWQAITWDPANTNLPPVNCFKVNVLLSTDGGFTYPITVASDLPNIGLAVIKVPNVPGFGNRIRIEAADNIFFDITDENIDIIAAGAPGFAYFTQEDLKGDCAPNDINFSIVTSSLQGFSNMISLNATNLPAGATASFSKNTISPNDTTQLTISNTGNVTPGIYHFQVIGTATSGETEILNLSVDIQNSVPNSVTLGSPLNGASNFTTLPTFFWVPFPGENDYLFEVATNPSFGSSTILSTLLDTNSYTFTTPLNMLTTYFWRVTASNVCGQGEPSVTRAFQTTTQGTPPTVPEVITNLPLNVIQWQNEVISNSLLEATDGMSSAGDLIYTLVSAPQNGFVELNNQAISVGETFTQNDINTGLVKYQHNGTNTSSDAFTFTIQNNNGGWFGTPTFQINITNTTSIADLAGFNIDLYPNPANGILNLSLSDSKRGNANLNLYTVHGKRVSSQRVEVSENESRIQWNTTHLPAGVYLLKIETLYGEIVKKVVIRH